VPRTAFPVAAAFVAVVGALLAGCAAGPDPAPTEDVPSREARGFDGTALATFAGTTCEGALFVAYVPNDAVAPELPPGYEAGLVGDSVLPGQGLNNPHLLAVSCAMVTLDNVTQTDVRVAYAGTLLATGGFYRWELFVDEANPLVLPVLQELGWPAAAATIAVDTASILIEADGVRYEVASAVPTQRQESAIEGNHLVHHAGPDGSRRLLAEDMKTSTGFEKMRGGALDAEGGTWGRIAARLTGPAAGALSPIYTDWSMEFYSE
jgi:hypothetical protein